MTVAKVGISNRIDPKARKIAPVRPDPSARRREREQAKADQIAAAWTLRERLTRKFAIDKWGVSPRG